MAQASRHDAWLAGESYDAYMGRWSLALAPAPVFLDWLGCPDDRDWLEIGCGTGALSRAILARSNPRSLLAIDPSGDFVTRARDQIADPRASFQVGDAQSLVLDAGSRDVIVSGLVLNFVSDRKKALAEMQRVKRPHGVIGAYVWDYPSGGVEFVHAFWQAATSVDSRAGDLSEDKRFPECTRQGLTDLFEQSGLAPVECDAIEIPTVFRDFDDLWQPFTMGAGPAPGYCASIQPDVRENVKQALSDALPRHQAGSVHLKARAWAIMSVAN